jgi:P-type Mg2+ transporter
MKVEPATENVDVPRRDDAIALANGELDPEEIWNKPVTRLLVRLASTPAGLDTAQARLQLSNYGPNDAATVKHSPLWLQFLARFRNPLVIILLVASGLSAAELHHCRDHRHDQHDTRFRPGSPRSERG